MLTVFDGPFTQLLSILIKFLTRLNFDVLIMTIKSLNLGLDNYFAQHAYLYAISKSRLIFLPVVHTKSGPRSVSGQSTKIDNLETKKDRQILD